MSTDALDYPEAWVSDPVAMRRSAAVYCGRVLRIECNGESDFVLAKAAAAWLRVLREFSDSLAHLTFCLAGVLSSPNGIQGDSRPDIEALNEHWTNVETVAETIQTRLRGLDMDAEHWAPLKPRLDNAHDIVSTFQGQVCTAVSNCVRALTNDYGRSSK